ncbi:hypothetical protein ASD80_04150 [Devosia sp. Root635]|nr:hypothetical protein ASD80_04150 [Devosia sp. Root635]
MLAGTIPAWAQTWDGSDSTDMSDGNNWVGGVAPAPGANIVITGPAVQMPTIDGDTVTANILYVGHDAIDGGATLDLINGASLTTASASVGEAGNNNAGNLLEEDGGLVALSGASDWSTDWLNIGAYGDGSVFVTDGSTLTAATSLQLGTHYNATTLNQGMGTLEIFGAGSKVTSQGVTVVGASGNGGISVSDEASLVTGATTLGQNFEAYGVLDIAGEGSRWDVTSGTTVIGGDGLGGVLISDGATASTVALGGAGRINIGQGYDGQGVLFVTGTGSQIDAGQIWAGMSGLGGVQVDDGGVVNATHLLLGTTTDGLGLATINGAGSLLDASTYAMIGYLGYGQAVVSNGGTLRGTVRIAYGAGSFGVLTVGGASTPEAPGTIDAPSITFGDGDGLLGFNHTGADLDFAPDLVGDGGLFQLAGTTILSGDGSLFTGETVVQGGTLRVMQTLGGTVDVFGGGMLGGSGTVGTTVVDALGSIAPDGLLSVDGDLTFENGSFYLVDAVPGAHDSIAATGTVTLNGGTVQHQAAADTFDWQESVRILSSETGLSGTFADVTSALAFLDPTLDYDTPNEVWLTLSRNDVAFEDVGSTGNQGQVGQALSGLPGSNPLVQAMLGLTPDQARDALNQLAGDTHGTLQDANMALAQQVQNFAAARVRQTFAAVSQANPVSAYAGQGVVEADDRLPVGVWLQGLGDYVRVEPNGGAGGLTAGAGGVLGGADVLLPSNWRLGVLAGYTGSGFAAIDRPATGTAQNLHAGIYASAALDAIRLQGNAMLTWHGLSTRRDVSFGGLTDTLTASYGARTAQVFGEAGYVFDMGSFELEPFGSLSYALTHTDAFAETGGPAALSSAAASNNSTTTLLGARMAAPFAVNDMLVAARGMLGWQHQNGTAPSSQMALAGSGPFTVSGASFAGDALAYEAGLNIDVNAGLNIDVVYGGQVSAGDFTQSIKGIVGGRF